MAHVKNKFWHFSGSEINDHDKNLNVLALNFIAHSDYLHKHFKHEIIGNKQYANYSKRIKVQLHAGL